MTRDDDGASVILGIEKDGVEDVRSLPHRQPFLTVCKLYCNWKNESDGMGPVDVPMIVVGKIM